MGLKNVSTDIIASSDRGDIKTMSPLPLAVSMPEMKVIFEERAAIFESEGDLLKKEAEDRIYQ